MKQNDSELEREISRLKKIKIYQIIMSITLFLAMLFAVLWIVTIIKLNAQKKLRGDFDHISLVIKLTHKSKDKPSSEGEELLTPEETFNLYNGPYLDKGYYGMSLGNYLSLNGKDHFYIEGGMIKHINIPQRNDLPPNQYWLIFSYSERDIDRNGQTKGILTILLDRVNIFIFQLNNPLTL